MGLAFQVVARSWLSWENQRGSARYRDRESKGMESGMGMAWRWGRVSKQVHLVGEGWSMGGS